MGAFSKLHNITYREIRTRFPEFTIRENIRPDRKAGKATSEEQRLAMENASLRYLSDGKDEIFELFQRVRDEFDGSEYMQGKKDGLRIALALLGNPEMLQFNRGGGMAREKTVDRVTLGAG